MRFDKVAVLTSAESWFVPYAKRLVALLGKKGYKSKLFFKHEDINETFRIVFILSYFKMIGKGYLKRHDHNLVVHESALPRGKGWAPFFWQVIEGKKKIPIVLFEASEDMDGGETYIKDYLSLKGHELYNELRDIQANKTIDLCLRFLGGYDSVRPKRQRGRKSFYKKRGRLNSKLDINKPLQKQFNLLRTVDNENFPAFFPYKKHKYIVKIYKEDNDRK